MAVTRTYDLTKGTPWKVIVKFTLPMLLSAIFQQLYTSIDSIFMGQFVSGEAQSAIGATASMINLFLNFSIGISTGLGIVVAQYVGAKNDDGIHRCAVNAFLLLIVTSVVVSAIALIASRPILRLLKTPDDIIQMAYTYSTIVLAGLICTLAYNMTSAILRALGNSEVPLYFLIFSSLLHVVLDFIFIPLLHMGVAGVAVANIVSQGVAAALTAVYMYKKYPAMRFRLNELRPDYTILKKVARLGIPMGLQSDCFAIGMMTIQGTINSFGAIVVHGYTAGVRVEEITWIAFTTLGQAMSTYAGQNAGAKDIERIKKGWRQTAVMMLILTLTATAAAWIFGRSIISLFIPDRTDPAFEIAYGFLKVNSAFFLFMGMLMLYQGILRGIGEIVLPLISAGVELSCKVGFALLLSVIFGYFGIWFAEPFGWVLALIPLAIRYHSGRWQKPLTADTQN